MLLRKEMCRRMTGPFIARIIFAVTVMLAALAFAPSAGMAHTGHDHGPSATHATALISLSAVTEIEPATVVNAVITARWIVATSAFPAGNQSLFCVGGCCSAASASCCAVTVPVQSGIPSPQLGEVIFATVQREGAGVIPGTLFEPPKLLV
jgi:hypothetical protein